MSRNKKVATGKGKFPMAGSQKRSKRQLLYNANRDYCQEVPRKMDKRPEPGYWAVIPAAVRYDDRLPPNAKLLYAEISSLTDGTGYCFAGNAYFQALYGLSERTIQNLLRVLQDCGYIRIADGDGGPRRRKIFAGINPLQGNPAENFGVPNNPEKNCGVTPQKIAGSTLKTSKVINSPLKPPQGGSVPEWKPERFERFWNYYPRLPDGRKPNRARAAKAWDKLRPDDRTIDAMATALQRQKNSDQWRRGFGIPYASTWLNGRMWEEDYVPPEDEGGVDEVELPEWT